MKYARDTRPSRLPERTAQTLFEALPWIKNITGKTVVIKYGGSAMEDEALRSDVMSDIVLLKIIGMNPGMDGSPEKESPDGACRFRKGTPRPGKRTLRAFCFAATCGFNRA